MNRQPNSAFAVIDYGKTVGVCMDVYCGCGRDFHFHDEDGKSAEHVRCPFCKDVLRIGADVNLLSERENFNIDHGPSVFIQWKGSDIHMQGNCTCGEQWDITGWFAYEKDCPKCGKHFHCESHLTLTKLTSEEAALVAHINEPEKDYEDMDDGERTAYDERMSHLAAEQEARRAAASKAMLADLSGFELGHLADPGGNAFDYAQIATNRPQDTVVLLGDVVDSGIGAVLSGHTHRSLPVVLGADAPRTRVVVLPDIHVPHAGDQSMQRIRSFLAGFGNGGGGNRQSRRRNKKR